MRIKKLILVLTFLILGTQALYGNYAFYRKVVHTCKYYRVDVKSSDMSLTKSSDGSYSFSIQLTSKRNDFEMVMLVGFISVGQAIKHQQSFAAKNPDYFPVIPQNTEVVVTVPVSRNNMVISARANMTEILLLSEGKLTTAEFMQKIKNSIKTL